MTRNNLNKDLLGEILIGGSNEETNARVLETEEVQSLMYHQWKNPHEVHVTAKPDFKHLFESISSRVKIDELKHTSPTHYLISEVNELKRFNRTLRRRMVFSLSAAASILLLIAVTTIFVLKRNTDLTSSPVQTKTFTENIVPNGQKSQLILPDGSKVFLNSGTILKYDNFFGTRYRTLELTGEAYFEVSRNENMPFKIKTGNIEVEVLGTKFNLMAYHDDDYVETIVIEGEVSVTDTESNTREFLKANQRATFNKGSHKLVKEDVNPETYISWKENILSFDNQDFSYVIRKLERWYDVSISVQGTDSIADRYTMTIGRESLSEVLDLISRTTNIDYKIKDSHVSIIYK